MRFQNSALGLWMWIVLASLTAGYPSGAHPASSNPTLLAQVTCLNTMSCCIQRFPLTAAQSCGASAAEIAKALNGAKVLHDATQPEEVNFKEEAHEHENAEAGDASEVGDSDEPPNCKGQNHHVISRPIAEELEKHRALRGLYKPRDERFVARAQDKDSHCGYQQWHRDVDKEVIRWLQEEFKATPKQFEKFLRELYNRPEMRKRFPNGF